jgi:hypothetical protein
MRRERRQVSAKHVCSLLYVRPDVDRRRTREKISRHASRGEERALALPSSASSQIFIVLARVQPWADCGNELDYSQYELLLTLRGVERRVRGFQAAHRARGDATPEPR